jgi:membrane-associated phospholipid phosphatase
MISKTDKIKKILKNKFLYLGLFVLIFGAVLNQVSSIYIFDNFKDIPVLRDSILDLLPNIKLGWVFDFFSVLAILCFIIYAYTKEFEKIPYFLLIFGILQILRGIFVVLTPFANPDIGTYNGFLQSSEMFRRGLFPSGHTGSAFLAFLFVRGPYRIFFLTIALFLIGALLLAHGHYSIDIFSAVIFAYAVYAFGEKHFKKIFTLN